MVEVIEGESFTGEDWYAEDLADRAYTRCTFTDIDLTEATSRGAVFDECRFFSVRFNASRHSDSAFLRCTFQRCNLFEAEFTGCKLVGSVFIASALRPLRVTGGDWSFIALTGADLRGTTFHAVRMREVDLAGANCEGACLTDVDLSGAHLRGIRLAGCDLRGSDLSALDPATVQLAGAVINPEQALVIARALGLEIR